MIYSSCLRRNHFLCTFRRMCQEQFQRSHQRRYLQLRVREFLTQCASDLWLPYPALRVRHPYRILDQNWNVVPRRQFACDLFGLSQKQPQSLNQRQSKWCSGSRSRKGPRSATCLSKVASPMALSPSRSNHHTSRQMEIPPRSLYTPSPSRPRQRTEGRLRLFRIQAAIQRLLLLPLTVTTTLTISYRFIKCFFIALYCATSCLCCIAMHPG